MARKKEIVREEDSDSDSEIITKMKKEEVTKNINDSSESEEDDDSDSDDIPNNASINPLEMVRVEGSFSLELKLKLLKELRSANKRKTSTYKVALRHLDWSLVKVDELSTDEAKSCLKEILKPICTVRTLDEMLTDYELHHQKFDLKMHPDAPKVPRNAVMKFIDDNREKLKKMLAKQFPDKVIGLKEISSFGAKKFAELPMKEQERYKNQYKEELKIYTEKKAKLLKECPDLIKKRAKKERAVREKVGQSKKDRKKDLSYITPFMVFLEELGKEGRDVKYVEAQSRYKNMPDDEKMKYIQSLVMLETELEKRFSSHERKIMKNSNGMPQKPLSSYNLFIKELCQGETVNKKDMLKTSSAIWKTLSQDQRQKYEDEHKRATEEWKAKMEEWFLSLPAEQRPEQMAKYGFLANLEANKKRRLTEITFSEDYTSTPVKKQKKIDEIITMKKEEPKEKSVINIIPAATPSSKAKTAQPQITEFLNTKTPEVSPKKKKKERDSDTSSFLSESMSKKNKFKDAIESFGSYPSLTTAHYFMKQRYDGKPNKIAKAYIKLSKDEKKKLYEQMKKIKAEYFMKFKKFIEENGKYADKARQFHESNRKEQQEVINWHKENGTDRSESESSSSDDSDSE